MKAYATGLDGFNGLDPYFKEHYFCTDSLTRVTSIAECDYIFICLALKLSFKFNVDEFEQIQRSDKPIIIFDYTEYGEGSYSDGEYHKFLYGNRVFGWSHSANLGRLKSHAEYAKLISSLNQIKKERILCYFMREMPEGYNLGQVPFPIFPCDYTLNNLQETMLASFNLYRERPIAVVFNSGAGVRARCRMYGELYIYAAENNYLVASTQEQLDYYMRNKRRVIALFNREGHAKERIDFRPLYKQAKIVIDMAGSGIKCVRNLESALFAASTKQISRLKFAYPWIHNDNCIEVKTDAYSNRVKFETVINSIDRVLNDDGLLYDIYVRGRDTAIEYLSKNYVPQYIVKTIEGIKK